MRHYFEIGRFMEDSVNLKQIGRLMHEFAMERCEGRRYGLLEGGYYFEDLGKNVLAFCEGLRGK